MTTSLVELAAQQKATDFQEELDSRMADKISVALDARKTELAQAMFGEETKEPKKEEDCKHSWHPVTKSNGKTDDACTHCGVLKSTVKKAKE